MHQPNEHWEIDKVKNTMKYGQNCHNAHLQLPSTCLDTTTHEANILVLDYKISNTFYIIEIFTHTQDNAHEDVHEHW